MKWISLGLNQAIRRAMLFLEALEENLVPSLLPVSRVPGILWPVVFFHLLSQECQLDSLHKITQDLFSITFL